MPEESLLSTGTQEAVDTAPQVTDTPEPTASDAPAIERPEWLLDKYITEDKAIPDAISEQAKAYVELQKQFGGFTGAPEEYQFEMPEGVDGEIDTELDTYKQFVELAKSSNMGQETAQGLFNLFVSYQNQMNAQVETDFNKEREALGPQADSRIKAVAQWANSNLEPQDMAVLETMTLRADQIEVLEKLIGKTRNSPIPKTNQVESVQTGYSESQFHADVNSDRYKTDRQFRESVRKKAAALFPGA